ncbi:MAG: pyridoxine 5'-phosphate synthase [Polyangiaceae bacterium]|jgi:pyridoxine 5-phosphate synthase
MGMGVRLHVNVDHVATLRNVRGTSYPDPVRAAAECVQAGADGVTAHLREDRRHIRDDDVDRLRFALTLARSTFNLEMAATDEMVAVALRVRPDVCTLVPERRQERTTEGGLDVVGGGDALSRRVEALASAGIKVSLFIAPDRAQVEGSRALRAAQVELHTGEYAHGREGELARLGGAAQHAAMLGLEVAAGHGLTVDNLPAIVTLPHVVELNIGHAVVSDALFVGLPAAVGAYRQAIERGLQRR